jgi:D-tagatose-1,6-bisphosphate aldolase subunit GatZ/KbaZ
MVTTSAPLNPILQLVKQHKAGNPLGVYSACSANPFVLKAVMVRAKQYRVPLLIESTINQVNQFGGYMGLMPRDFVAYLHGLAAQNDIPAVQLIIGGDHLGPTLWASEPAESAMQKACAALMIPKSLLIQGFQLSELPVCAPSLKKPSPNCPPVPPPSAM